jgi:Pvc16 N-terminal domain
MLPEVHQAIQDLIYREGRIERSEVDVAFEVPTKEFVDKLVRPTLNLHLVELQENTDLRQAQFQASQTNGKAQFRALPRRIDLRYVVTALTTNSDDAFRLLWRVLGVLMRSPELPPELLPKELTLDFPIPARVAQPDSGLKLLDIWSAVGGEPRAAFGYVLTVPMDLALTMEAPLVLSRNLDYRSLNGSGRYEEQSFIHGVVRDSAGVAIDDATIQIVDDPSTWTRSDKQGAFGLRAPRAGNVVVRVTTPDGVVKDIDLNVPATAYDLRIDGPAS